GGEILVDSAPGRGSTFTLYLPSSYITRKEGMVEDAFGGGHLDGLAAFVGPDVVAPPALSQADPSVTRAIEDDRERLREGDRVLLIVEDDVKFARIMVNLARERGFKAVVANRGDMGLALANELAPSAITLDLQLPVVDGWNVLAGLKKNPST